MTNSLPIDPQPLIHLLKEHGGKCQFDEGVRILTVAGLTENDARASLWMLLSQGIVEFTTDRDLRLPQSGQERAAG